MADISPDPWSQVHAQLWAKLVAYAGFAALVQPLNRLNYAGTFKTAIKPGMQPADSPEVQLSYEGMSGRKTSTGTQYTAQWSLDILDENKDPTYAFFPTKWAALKALHLAGNTLGLAFVTDVLVFDETAQETLDVRGAGGRISAVKIQVQISVTHDQLES